MMDASQCDSKRSGWQGLTAGRRAALGASVATVSAAALMATASVVALFAAVAPLVTTVAALVTAIAALVTAGLAARLAVARVALIPLEMASAPAPTAATTILTLLGIFSFAAGSGGGLGLRRDSRDAAEKFLHPGEKAARFRRRLGFGRGCGIGPCGLIALGPSGSSPGRTCVTALLGRAVIPAVPLWAEDGPLVAAVITRRTGGVGAPTRLSGGLVRDVAERFAFPIMFDALRRLGRKDLQLWHGLRLGRSGPNRCLIGNPHRFTGDWTDWGGSFGYRNYRKRSRYGCWRRWRQIGHGWRGFHWSGHGGRRSERVLVFGRRGEDGHHGWFIFGRGSGRSCLNGLAGRAFAAGKAGAAVVTERAGDRGGVRWRAWCARRPGSRGCGAGRFWI